MKPATWRALLLIFCAAGMLLSLAGVADQLGMGSAPAWYGVMGGYFDGSPVPYHLRFRGVDPTGPAYRGGLREGDLVDITGHTRAERLSMIGQPQALRPVTFSVERGSLHMSVVVVPAEFTFSRFWNFMVWEFGNLWLLLFAALIAWRRPYAGNNLLLATVLAFVAVGFSAESIFFGLPWAWGYAALVIVNQALSLAVALWSALASSIARPLSTARRLALVLCYAFVAAGILIGDGTPDRTIGLIPLVGTWTLWFDPTKYLGLAWTIPGAAAVFMALICSALSVAASRGVDRQRALWLLLPLAFFFIVIESTTLLFHFLSYSKLLLEGQVYSLMTVLTPLVLTYVALNRRLIDIGFVLNRTVVFAIVSTIVIGAFVLVEWAAGAWLVNASHTTSVVVSMVVALALGLSLRFIHKYVDRFVDRVLFRKRHDDESALRRFAHEASYITQSSALVARSLETVRTHANVQFADIVLRTASETYVTVSDGNTVGENDPALVALRAWSKPVDLEEFAASAMRGELAFPMISRGRLIGALVCGPKRDGETFAPDETDALQALAHGVGTALDVLDAKADSIHDPALAEIRQSIGAVLDATRSLPEAIAEHLRRGVVGS